MTSNKAPENETKQGGDNTAARSDGAHLSMNTSPITAIIVDDDDDNRTIFRNVLESISIQVTEFANPLLARDDLNNHSYSLLILDLQMPLLSGRDLLKTITPNPIHKNMQILVITAHAHLSNSTDIEKDAHFLMYKPISPGALAVFVRRITAPKL